MLNRKLAGGALQAPEKPGRDPDSDKSVPKLPSKPPSLMLATETPQLPLSEIKSVGLSLSAPSPKPQQAIVKDVSTDSPRNSDVSRRVSQSMIPVPSQGSHTDIKAPATEVIVKRIERNPNSRRSEVFESNPNKSGGPTIQRIERRSTVQHQAGQVKVVTVNDGSGGGTGAPHTKLQEEKQDTVNSMDSAGNRVRFDMNESSETAPKAPQGKSVTGERPSGILRRPADVDMVQSPIIEEREEGSKNAEKKYVAMSVIAKPADISESTTKSAFLPAEKGIQVKSTTVSVSNSRAVDNAPTTFDGNFKPLPAPEKPSQRPLASEVSNYSKTPTEGSNPTISKNSPKTKDSKSLQASSSASLTRKTITVSKKKLIPLDGPVPSNDGPVKEVPGVKSGPETAKPSVKNLSAKELKEPSGKESSLKNDPPKLLRTVAKDLQKVEKPSKDKLSAPKLEMSNADVAKETLVNDKLNLAAKEANIRADHLANKEDRKPRSKSVPPSVTRKDEVKGSKSTAPLKPEIKKPPEEEALKRQKSTSEPKGKTQKLEKLQLDEKAKRASIGDIKSTMGPGLSKVSSKKGDESLKSSKEKLTAGGTAKKTNDKSKTKPTQDLKPSGDNLANFSSNLIPSETVEVPPVNISSDSTTSLPIDLSETRLQRALRLRSKLKMDIDGCFAMGLSDPSDDLAKPAEETDAKIEPEIPVPKKPEPPPPVIKADVKTAASTTESLPSSLRISSPLPLERHPSARRKVIKNLGYPATGWTIETLNREEVPDKPRFYKFRRARSLEDVSRIYNWYRQTFPLPFGHYTNYNDVFRATKNDIVQVTRRL
ncbi:hypothetical protein BC830DRAFT_593351 [Chytriomyces sp. MP71]|nr:hypothetical protein BC830DRAFT_593351 [Chytriomyces sp. MP71]